MRVPPMPKFNTLASGCSYPLSEAIRVLTENPARSLGLYPYKGSLQEQSCADILLLNDQLEIDTVIANGRVFLEHGELKYKPKFE